MTDYELIKKLEHELDIAGHEDACLVCTDIRNHLQPVRDNRGKVQFWLGADGRKFLRPDEAVAHYLRQRA